LGLSIPYLNRILHDLRDEGLVHVRDQSVHIDDLVELTAVADFEHAYLQPAAIAAAARRPAGQSQARAAYERARHSGRHVRLPAVGVCPATGGCGDRGASATTAGEKPQVQLSPDERVAMPEADRIDPRRAALIAYDVCRRALIPADPARRLAMRPVLDAWIRLLGLARAAGMPVIYTTPVSRADGADVVMLPTDLSAETGVPPLTNAVEGTAEAGFPEEIAPLPADFVFLKRRPSAFWGTGVAELLHMLRRDTIIIGGGATNRGVETSVREAFNHDLASIVVRECCWSGDAAAHAYSLDKAMKMYARVRSLGEVAAMLRD
jgi:maleamate amidohydrolase